MKRPLQIFVRGLGFPTKGEAGLCLVTNVIKRKIMHLHVARTLEMRGRKQLERQKGAKIVSRWWQKKKTLRNYTFIVSNIGNVDCNNINTNFGTYVSLMSRLWGCVCICITHIIETCFVLWNITYIDKILNVMWFDFNS